MFADHRCPRVGIAILKGEAFCVRPIREQHWKTAFGDRPENIGAQDDAVIHPNGRVPVDFHPVADFSFCLRVAFLGHLKSSRTKNIMPAKACPSSPRRKAAATALSRKQSPSAPLGCQASESGALRFRQERWRRRRQNVPHFAQTPARWRGIRFRTVPAARKNRRCSSLRRFREKTGTQKTISARRSANRKRIRM